MPRKRTTTTQADGANGARAKTRLPKGLKNSDLVDYYTRLVQARSLDERIWALNRQGKVPIAASSQGHEAAQLGSLLAAEKDGDCFLFPYYRDLALKVAAGLTPVQTMMSFMGKAGDPYSNGRQFPLQGADLPHKIIQISNVVAAGLTQSVGYALGCRMAGEKTVVLVYFGDGATSQGETHEAMNFASIHKLPVIFICENNRYAISTPKTSQMAIEEFADRASSYGFPGFTVDGMDLVACYEATREAIIHARSQGPVLLEMMVERFMSHTTDDDDSRYRPEGEVERARERDPVVTLARTLIDETILTQKQVDEIAAAVLKATDEATDIADASSPPDESGLHDMVYSP
ncbi:MAG: thiamine pyrophosphate-dependent dehydrogenase E1 component subunit alpha [Chloroflexi bacterium]|jgi:2-oxoisovalerate dehydrogenase E1 component alpha subunit|nr:thiamine pyrophosphate-dependent dehydrogenase E1 component subunit alpha [Dehalococcoidia bacterium]PCJ78988.1 MAG: 2-oxoisovalerate dehydrogenase [Dehalococcoidia bacterium]RUA18829.1 MAG: thiamine pyrophosphate-dependent dehydrogenase E1 component subunit alpha [Chloroflexota bacterium]RUA32538.1 MAG: thiamine pyrophosphate-dependent dehydrogenase E1 component subunit alpha [Chloroflexota bacterium]